MTIQEQIVILEERNKNYKNNLEFAQRNNNKIRQTKYASLINEVNLQIKELERQIPMESNVRLREIIDEQNKNIAAANEANEKLQEEIKIERKRIDDFINPPKKVEPVEPDLETTIDHECPACGRTFKGSRGVKAHQSSGACKAAH